MRTGGGRLIDCQMHTRHLARLGARDIARTEFINYLESCLATLEDTDSYYPPPCWVLPDDSSHVETLTALS